MHGSRQRLRILAAALLAVNSADGLAKGGDRSFFSLALTRTQDVSRADGAKAEDTVTVLNVSGGFSLGSGAVAGIKYFDYRREGTVVTDAEMVTSGYGPMVGYLHGSGFFVTAGWLLFPTKVYKTGGEEIEYSGGSGHVIDVGKIWDVGSDFGAGLAVSQSQVAYKKVEGGGAEADLDGTWSDTSLYPYLALFFFF